jgi:membrane-bound serine protease (ClpP class)
MTAKRHKPFFRVLLVATLLLGAYPANGGSNSGVLLQISGPIGPATSDYIEDGLKKAVDSEATVVIIQMDTPGGLDTSMRDIIKAILASPVPVITYVAPGGSRAASAGTYILYASHIAAMAPATNLGAATPVPIGGTSPVSKKDKGKNGADGSDKASADSGEEEQDEEKTAAPGDASRSKAINDAIAYIRSLAEKHGRNVDWAEKAVREADSLSASQALELGVIDLIAEDIPALLAAVNGRVVSTSAGEITLETAGITLERIEPDWRTELLQIITNPTVAYLLMLIGIYGLLFEGYNPGAIVPGVAGAICLLIAAYAFQILPVNYAGFALMALGIILMIAEVFAPSFGALGFGGIIAFVVGSIILMDTDVPGFTIPIALIGSIGLAGAGAMMGIVWFAVIARQRPVVSGREQIIGSTCEADEDFDGSGHVLVHGEHWSAHCNEPVARGEHLHVTDMKGLVLTVRRAPDKEN